MKYILCDAGVHDIKHVRHDLAIKVAKCKIWGVLGVYSLYPTYIMGCAAWRVCCLAGVLPGGCAAWRVCCGNKITLAWGVQGFYFIVGFVQVYLLYRPVPLVSIPLIKNVTASKIPIAK